MKSVLAIILLIMLTNCNGRENKTLVLKKSIQKKENTSLLKADNNTSTINFFDAKYKKNGYYLPDNLTGKIYPMYSYMNENLGAFSVNYIGKTEEERNFWSVYNHEGFFKDKKIEKVSSNSDLIEQSLKSRSENYYIITNFLDGQYIQNFDKSSGEFDIKDKAVESIYIFDNKTWKLIKKVKKIDIPENTLDFYSTLASQYYDKSDNKQQAKTDFKGKYSIDTKAISQYDNKEIELYYAITIKNDKSAILSIGAEQVQDYWCEGPYSLSNENNIIHAKGKCDQDDMADFYLKSEDGKYYIKSKRFINSDWQLLKKKN